MRRFLGLVIVLAVAGFLATPRGTTPVASAAPPAPPSAAPACLKGLPGADKRCAMYQAFQRIRGAFSDSLSESVQDGTEEQAAGAPPPPPIVPTTCLGLPVTVSGTDGNNANIQGTEGDDVIATGDGNDTVNAGGGNDIICVGMGTKTINGGEGVDIVSYEFITVAPGIVVDLALANSNAQRRTAASTGTNCAINSTAGQAFTHNFTGIDGVAGSIFADCLQGNDVENGFEGRGGADFIDGRGGFDVVTFLTACSGVTANLSTNTATTFEGLLCIIGGNVTDTLQNLESIVGSFFDDTITGDNNPNVLDGGFGGNDTISGLGGDDVLSGGPGNDTLNGGDGNDALVGGEGSDTLTGGNNDDILEGGAQNDSLNGGTGRDTASYLLSIGPEGSEELGAVSVNLATGAVSGGGAAGDTIVFSSGTSTIENIVGSSFDDTLVGDGQDNFLTGGLGANALNGAGGNDTADYTVAPAGVTANLGTGAATVIFEGDTVVTDTLTAIENLTGSFFDDVLLGTATGNTLTGQAGDDLLLGLAGADTIDGGDDVDTCDFVDADTHTACEDNDADGYLDANDPNPNVFCMIMRGDFTGGLNGVSDGSVSILDLAAVASAFGQSVPPASVRLDQNFDFTISILDLAGVAGNFGKNVDQCLE